MDNNKKVVCFANGWTHIRPCTKKASGWFLATDKEILKISNFVAKKISDRNAIEANPVFKKMLRQIENIDRELFKYALKIQAKYK